MSTHIDTTLHSSLHSSNSAAPAGRGRPPARNSGGRSRWLTRLVPIAALVGFATPAIAGHDATANAYQDGKIVATARFIAGADRFEVTKVSHTVGHRAYLEYKYIRKDGTVQEGQHWGVSRVGHAVPFDHNFGKDRKVVFRVCVQVSLSPDVCSDWETGYAG